MKPKVYGIISAIWACFIFSNSFKSGVKSDGMSAPLADGTVSLFSKLSLNLDPAFINMIVRKGAHFAEFLLLGVFIALAYKALGKKLSFYSSQIMFFCLAAGVTDEFIQSFITGRSSDVRDILIDFAGGLIGMGIIFLTVKRKHSFRNYSWK